VLVSAPDIPAPQHGRTVVLRGALAPEDAVRVQGGAVRDAGDVERVPGVCADDTGDVRAVAGALVERVRVRDWRVVARVRVPDEVVPALDLAAGAEAAAEERVRVVRAGVDDADLDSSANKALGVQLVDARQLVRRLGVGWDGGRGRRGDDGQCDRPARA
jgi:hypothetical protein